MTFFVPFSMASGSFYIIFDKLNKQLYHVDVESKYDSNAFNLLLHEPKQKNDAKNILNDRLISYSHKDPFVCSLCTLKIETFDQLTQVKKQKTIPF